MYDEYKNLPFKIQKELAFSNFMDFHPKLQNKTDLAKKNYFELA